MGLYRGDRHADVAPTCGRAVPGFLWAAVQVL